MEGVQVNMDSWDVSEVDTAVSPHPQEGIVMVPQVIGGSDRPVLAPDAGDFAKWMAQEHADIPVEGLAGDHLALHSHDIWLPLVSLGADITLQTYLGVVSNYVYDRLRGALNRSRQPTVSLSVEYREDSEGKSMRLDFKGDHAALETLLDKFDGNRLLE